MEKWKLVNILEVAIRKTKRSQIWDSGLLLEHIWGTFDLAAINVIWESFGDLTIFRKWAFQKVLLLPHVWFFLWTFYSCSLWQTTYKFGFHWVSVLGHPVPLLSIKEHQWKFTVQVLLTPDVKQEAKVLWQLVHYIEPVPKFDFYLGKVRNL